ncbi:MAG: NAD(P)-dependent oxidoreductase [Ignavibacteria bacterium]
MKDKIIKILVADKINLSGAKILDRTKFSFTISPNISQNDILKRFSNYQVLVIRSGRKITSEFLSKCNFEVIVTASKGVDHIDINYAKERGIPILSLHEANSVSTAEHTLGLIIEAMKRIRVSDEMVRKGSFSNHNFPRRELEGKKIGIIGVGRVGRKVADFCKALNMKILANDINRTVVEKNSDLSFFALEHILKNSHILTIHIPLTKDNYRYFSSDRLSLLRRTAVLINTSRGEVLDEEYLIDMLKEKRLAYACLDVFCNEPGVNPEFFSLKNVTLTNHIAGKTRESEIKISKEIFSLIRDFYLFPGL